jgi:excisionase family DNA binding protein
MQSSAVQPSTGTALLSVRDVAELLKVSPRTVRRMSDAGRMPRPLRISSLVRWDRESLLLWIAEGCKPVRSASPKGAAR